MKIANPPYSIWFCFVKNHRVDRYFLVYCWMSHIFRTNGDQEYWSSEMLEIWLLLCLLHPFVDFFNVEFDYKLFVIMNVSEDMKCLWTYNWNTALLCNKLVPYDYYLVEAFNITHWHSHWLILTLLWTLLPTYNTS